MGHAHTHTHTSVCISAEQARRLEILAGATIHWWDFFFLRKSSVLLLKLFNRLDEVHPDNGR